MRLAPQRAEDMVQSFFLEKIMLQDILSAATPLKGRFRSFVMKVFDNFIMSQLRAQKAIKRRPSSPDAVCIEDLPDLRSAEKTPPESFDALWARQILSQTIDLMKKRCCAGNQHILWRLFEARILSPLLDGNPPIPYETLVKHFGLRSPSEASNLLITAKRMFARMLREIVRETVSEDRETEMEIMELKRILSK